MKRLIILILAVWTIHISAYSVQQDTRQNKNTIKDSTTRLQRIRPAVSLDDNQMYYIEKIRRYKSDFFNGFIIYARANNQTYRILAYNVDKTGMKAKCMKIRRHKEYKFTKMEVSSYVFDVPMNWDWVMTLRDAKIFLDKPDTRYVRHFFESSNIYGNYVCEMK